MRQKTGGGALTTWVPTSVRLHQLLVAAALLVPAALFAGAAWQDHGEVLREGREVITRTTTIMLEHARKVFETEELMLSLVDERIGGQAWPTIAAPATSAFLHKLKAPLEQAVSAWIADGAGTIQAGSQPWAAGSSIADRDFFTVQRDGQAGTYVSASFIGRATGIPSFAVSRRRSTADGSFDGTVHVAVNPDYFAKFYADAAPPYAHLAVLLRVDGAVLARSPETAGPERLAPAGPLMQHIVAQPLGGRFENRLALDGITRFYEYRKVGAYPVYVVFGVERDVLLIRWWENLFSYGAFATGAALTLLLVSWLALRRAQAEQTALTRLRQESAQRLAAEQQLRHAHRLEAVGRLTGGVAHDFNNLLTAILGNLELILRATKGGPIPERRSSHAKITRLAETAVKAVQRGTALTKSLLAFSRAAPLHIEPLDLNALLNDFIDLVRQAVGLTIAVEVAPGEALPHCRADAAQLEAALLNLAINARDAMPGGGRLRIATGLAALSAYDLIGNDEASAGEFVRLTIADDGEGMPPEVAAKAFEPFFTTKPIGQGTGLGLSQVFGFVRQLGGHVTLQSTPGQGTAITLFLPVAK